MSKLLRALIVEDSEDDAMLLVRELQESGYELTFAQVETRKAMQSQLKQQAWDIVFADFTMPRFNAFEALRVLHETELDLPFIIVSGTIGEDRAVLAMKAGAHDYILKENMKRLVPAVERELREARTRNEHKQAEKTIHRMAFYDMLTDLPNRSHFRDRTQQAVQSSIREGTPVGLLMMDLRRFKEVNETLGHRHGDQLLQQVGKRLRETIFQNDLVARLGSDVFGILFSRITAMGDIEIATKKILHALETPFVIEDVSILVEVSMGAVTAPEHGTDADTLLQYADVAMHRAKEVGSDLVLYDPTRNPHHPRRLALMAELHKAIENNHLQLYYQPKIALATGRMIGAEALIRWQHPANGMIAPDQFIGPAENTGLIRSLTEWVLDTGLRQCSDALSSGVVEHLAINISARSLYDLNFPNMVDKFLKANDVSPEKLTLEVTETAIMMDLHRTVENLAVLNHMGIVISIDDFGTGFSSLNYIKRLPVHEIKIDKSFVIDMMSDRHDLSIVRSIIELGHNLGLKVVAEGIESKAILDSLTGLGCDYGQGYYISHPLPHTQFLAWSDQTPGK